MPKYVCALLILAFSIPIAMGMNVLDVYVYVPDKVNVDKEIAKVDTPNLEDEKREPAQAPQKEVPKYNAYEYYHQSAFPK